MKWGFQLSLVSHSENNTTQMKRIVLLFLIMAVPAVAFAQDRTPRSNSVSVSVKRVTETKFEKERKTYDAKVGFQQMAGLNIGVYGFYDLGIGVSYVGGYRFNNWLFMGAGVEWNVDVLEGCEQFYAPVYAQVRTYFTKRIWRPFTSLSFGYYAEKFPYYDVPDSASGPYADFTFGVDGKVHEKFNVYTALSVNNQGVYIKCGLSF